MLACFQKPQSQQNWKSCWDDPHSVFSSDPHITSAIIATEYTSPELVKFLPVLPDNTSPPSTFTKLTINMLSICWKCASFSKWRSELLLTWETRNVTVLHGACHSWIVPAVSSLITFINCNTFPVFSYMNIVVVLQCCWLCNSQLSWNPFGWSNVTWSTSICCKVGLVRLWLSTWKSDAVLQSNQFHSHGHRYRLSQMHSCYQLSLSRCLWHIFLYLNLLYLLCLASSAEILYNRTFTQQVTSLKWTCVCWSCNLCKFVFWLMRCNTASSSASVFASFLAGTGRRLNQCCR